MQTIIRVIFSALLIVACWSGAASVSAQIMDYGPHDFTIWKSSGDSVPTIKKDGVVLSDHWDSFFSYMGGYTTHELVFEFETQDYFPADGHFAIAVRSNGVTGPYNNQFSLMGHGIALGDNRRYNKEDPDDGRSCVSTSLQDALAPEEFWQGGNCLYGAEESVELQNNVRYRIHILSSEYSTGLLNRYHLYENVGSSWDQISSGFYHVDPAEYLSPTSYGGYFMTEAISSGPWTVDIYNLRSYKCYMVECSP